MDTSVLHSISTSAFSRDNSLQHPPLSSSRLSASSQPSDLLPLHHSNYQQQPSPPFHPQIQAERSDGRSKEVKKGGGGGEGMGKSAWNWAAKFREAQETSETKRANDAGKRDPWIARKAAVGMVIAIVAYTSYVMIGGLCVPMIRRTQPNRGTRGRGMTLSMFIWSYSRIVLTGPGFVKDYVTPTVPDKDPSSLEDSSSPYSRYNPDPSGPPLPDFNPSSNPNAHQNQHHILPPIPFPPTAMPNHLPQPSSPPNPNLSLSQPSTLPPPVTSPPTPSKPKSRFVKRPRSFSDPPPQGWLERIPPFPEERFKWCRYCNWTKPERSHHCRICGTCVLVMDHHCPWVGGCVGAQNHKFFILFLLHSTIYTLSILIMTAITLRHLRPTIDGFLISMIALSGFFTLFTTPLLGSHVWLVLHNMTTIEQLRVSSHVRSEKSRLDIHFGAWGWNSIVEKQDQVRLWKSQWGSLDTTGNLYYISPYCNWTSKMGSNPLGWILPIGRPREDGSKFEERNERCGPEGEWRRREEWPEELRGK